MKRTAMGLHVHGSVCDITASIGSCPQNFGIVHAITAMLSAGLSIIVQVHLL